MSRTGVCGVARVMMTWMAAGLTAYGLAASGLTASPLTSRLLATTPPTECPITTTEVGEA